MPSGPTKQYGVVMRRMVFPGWNKEGKLSDDYPGINYCTDKGWEPLFGVGKRIDGRWHLRIDYYGCDIAKVPRIEVHGDYATEEEAVMRACYWLKLEYKITEDDE